MGVLKTFFNMLDASCQWGKINNMDENRLVEESEASFLWEDLKQPRLYKHINFSLFPQRKKIFVLVRK